MLLSEINPFIRYANQFTAASSKKYLLAGDCRMYFVLEAGENDYLYIDFKAYKLSKNAFAYFPSNTPYKFKVEGLDTKVLAINFDFSRENCDLTLPLATKIINNASDRNSYENPERIDDCDILNHHIFLENGEFSFDSLTTLKKRFATRNPLQFEEASALLRLTIVKSVINYSKSILLAKPDYKKKANLVHQIKQIIKDNFTEDLTNDAIARKIDYHPHHLNRIFQEIEGVSMHKYLINYRISVAEKLLLETNYSVTDIASNVGFNSTTRFSQNFVAKNKISPSKYRHICREN